MMTDQDFDGALADWLAPPRDGAPDRLFAARVDAAMDDLARLHRAERHYARGFIRDLAALAAAVLAGLALTRASGLAFDGWVVALPTALLLMVLLLGSGRHQPAGSSSAP